MTPFRRLISSIVEGQIRSYTNDHPEILIGHKGKLPPGKTKAEALVDSLAKRIVNDLTCADTRARLVSALHRSVEQEPQA